MGLANIFKKLLFARQVDFRGGKLTISNNRGLILPAITMARLQEELIKKHQDNKEVLMKVAYEQGRDAVSFAKNIGRETDVLRNILRASNLMGVGKLEIIKNKNEEKAVIHSKNPFIGHFYSKSDDKGSFFRKEDEGRFKTDEAVDIYIRGILKGVVESVWEKEVEIKETKCIALGDRYCEFVIKAKD